MSFLNKTGLSYLWTKIKNYLTGAHVSTSVISGATDVDGALTKLQTKIGTATLTTQAKNLSGAVNELDSEIVNVEDGLAIVANGDTHAAIASGQYVYVKGHSTLAEGMYKATAEIATNGALSNSNLVIATGGLNALLSDIIALNSKFTTAYKFVGTLDSEGLILSNLPLDGYVPIGVISRSMTRDGWLYTFVKQSTKNNSYWYVKIDGGSGDYSGTILAYKL